MKVRNRRQGSSWDGIAPSGRNFSDVGATISPQYGARRSLAERKRRERK
jgi:hypothetical protein